MTPFLTLLGQKFSAHLIDMLVKDCLTPSIPYDKHDEDQYKDLIEIAVNFYNSMKVVLDMFFTLEF